MYSKPYWNRLPKGLFYVVDTFLALLLTLGIGFAQGKPNLVWMKGLGHPLWAYASRDGAVQMRFVTGPDGESIRVVRGSDRRQMYSIYGGLSQYRAALSPNGQRMAFFQGADQLKLCRTDTGAVIWSKSMSPFDANTLSFSFDSSYLGFSVGNDVTILRASDGNLACTLHADNMSYEFSPNGSEVALKSSNGSGYHISFNFYRPSDGHFLRGWALDGGISGSFRGYSADGSLLALTAGNAGTSTQLFRASDGLYVGGLEGFNSPWGYHFEN
jgi:hypothetical protein